MLTVHWITNDGRPAIMEMQKLSGNLVKVPWLGRSSFFCFSSQWQISLEMFCLGLLRPGLQTSCWKPKAGLGLEWLRFSCVSSTFFRVCLFSYKVWARDGSKLRFQFGQDDQTPEEVVWLASFGCLGNSWQTWSAYIEFLWFSFSPPETHHYASRRSKTHNAKS